MSDFLKSSFVIYEDQNWFVVDKPPFISTHGSFDGDLALQEWIELHFEKKLFVVSRLDKETSGVIIFAKNKESSAKAQAIHEKEQSEKEYVFFSHIKKENSFECSESLDGKPCFTQFTYMTSSRFTKSFDVQEKEKLENNFIYVYLAKIKRGRTHQIRRHASICGLPILGCSEYGGKSWPRLALHCRKLIWPEIQKELNSSVQFDLSVKNCPQVYTSLQRRFPILSSITNCVRIFQRGEYGKNFSIDLFGKDFLISCYSDLNSLEQQFIETLCLEVANMEGLIAAKKHFRFMAKDATKVGLVSNRNSKQLIEQQPSDLSQSSGALEQFGANIGNEHSIEFTLDLEKSAQPGWFLDHRDFRKMVANISEKKRVLNLFSYSGGYGLAAALNNCEVVFNVDSSPSACKRAIENANRLKLNEKKNFKVVESDVLEYLRKQLQKMNSNNQNRTNDFRKFDIVVCDAPTVGKGNNSQVSFQVDKAWRFLCEACAALLDENGVAFFANNHQKGSSSRYKSELLNCFQSVVQYSQPFDFLSTRDKLPSSAQNSQTEPDSFHGRFFLCKKPKQTKGLTA